MSNSPEPQGRLEPVTIGLGTALGYSGDDLTSAAVAFLAGEVDHAAQDPDESPAHRPIDVTPVLELRVHGIGGAPPPVNLESPATVQVAGDGSAGFHRAWFPGGKPPLSKPPAERVPREAYCWGKLDYAGTTTALWLLLLPFALANLAHWAVPRAGRTGLPAASRAVLRLLGLVLTVAFTATAGFLLADVIAWQAAPRKALWSWLRWLGSWPAGARLALALYVVLAVVAGLFLLSLRTTKAYEAWSAGTGAPGDTGMLLSAATMWRGERTLVRQRYCHVMAACAVVILLAALPGSAWTGARLPACVVAGALASAALLITLSPWTDRIASAGQQRGGRDTAVRVLAIVSAAAAFALVTAQFWWPSFRSVGHSIPGDGPLQVIITFAEFGLVALLALMLGFQRPRRGSGVLAGGMAAAIVALLAAVIATVFGSALTLTVTNLLGSLTPVPADAGQVHDSVLFYVPPSAYAGGAGFLVVMAAVLVILAGLLIRRWSLIKRLSGPGPQGMVGTGKGTVRDNYADAGRSPASGPAAGDGLSDAVKTVATAWATSSLTDCAAWVLAGLALPAAVAMLAYEIALVAGHPLPGWAGSLAAIGASLAVLVAGLFLARFRAALTSSAERKKFGFIWDVITFWPRACHPLAPPCYAERSVPELVTRIRRLTGDVIRGADDPAWAQQVTDSLVPKPQDSYTRVLLSGYSQGAPISVAVMAQLPSWVRGRTALLTLAAPVRRLYGRAFPAWFGEEELERLKTALTSGTHATDIWWRNVIRRSDYIGGYVFAFPEPPAQASAGGVDRVILDPPALWPGGDPSPPPIHKHSNWFPDPQTRPAADELIGFLRY